MNKNKTVHISEDLHKKLKMEAVKLNMALKDLVEKKLDRPLSDK